MTNAPVTTHSTSIAARSTPAGTRAVQVRTSTTVSTPDFGRAFDRARCAQGPAAAPAPATPAPAPAIAACPASMDAAERADVSSLMRQLHDLIEQLMERLSAGNCHGHRSRPTTLGPPATTTPPAIPPAQGTSAPPSSTPPPANTPPQARPVADRATSCALPRRVFEVKAVAATAASDTLHSTTAPTPPAPTRYIIAGGSIALVQVHDGAKLDEGIRRISGFLDQVGAHVRAGGTFTAEQLGQIADEAFAIYREAIRANDGDGDLGDFTPAGRDGVLDLGNSNAATAAAATISAPAAEQPPQERVVVCDPTPAPAMSASTAVPIAA